MCVCRCPSDLLQSTDLIADPCIFWTKDLCVAVALSLSTEQGTEQATCQISKARRRVAVGIGTRIIVKAQLLLGINRPSLSPRRSSWLYYYCWRRLAAGGIMGPQQTAPEHLNSTGCRIRYSEGKGRGVYGTVASIFTLVKQFQTTRLQHLVRYQQKQWSRSVRCFCLQGKSMRNTENTPCWITTPSNGEMDAVRSL